MKTIKLVPNRYNDGFETADIRVTGARRARSTSISYHPSQIEKHGFVAREGKLDQWVLFATQHCTVIDNFGGSAAERERMGLELAVGEPFILEGVEGVWMLADRDQRKLEGDGVKPVPYVNRTRYAKIAAAPERVRPYLPDNYSVRTWGPGAIPGTSCTIIEGEDVAGWTLDGYVLPRLASGLYFGEEIFPFEVVGEVEVDCCDANRRTRGAYCGPDCELAAAQRRAGR